MSRLQQAQNTAKTQRKAMPRKGTTSKYSGKPINGEFFVTRTVQASVAYLNKEDFTVLPKGTENLPDISTLRGKMTKGKYFIDVRPFGTMQKNADDNLMFLSANFHARCIQKNSNCFEIASAPAVNFHGLRERLQGICNEMQDVQGFTIQVAKLEWTKTSLAKIRANKKNLFASLPYNLQVKQDGVFLSIDNTDVISTTHTAYLIKAVCDNINEWLTDETTKTDCIEAIKTSCFNHKNGLAVYQRPERNK